MRASASGCARRFPVCAGRSARLLQAHRHGPQPMASLLRPMIVDSWLPDLDLGEFLREFQSSFAGGRGADHGGSCQLRVHAQPLPAGAALRSARRRRSGARDRHGLVECRAGDGRFHSGAARGCKLECRILGSRAGFAPIHAFSGNSRHASGRACRYVCRGAARER